MFRISKLTDYATVVMTALAEDAAAVHSAQGVAERVRLELPTVSKLLKQLARAELVRSFRGVNGGYQLARAPNSISVADIVIAMEGPFGMTECSAHDGACGHEPHCGVRGNWRKISVAIETALRAVTLVDMQAPPAKRRRIPLHVVATRS